MAGDFYYVEKFRNNKTERIVTSSKISDIVDHFEMVRGWEGVYVEGDFDAKELSSFGKAGRQV